MICQRLKAANNLQNFTAIHNDNKRRSHFGFANNLQNFTAIHNQIPTVKVFPLANNLQNFTAIHNLKRDGLLQK